MTSFNLNPVHFIVLHTMHNRTPIDRFASQKRGFDQAFESGKFCEGKQKHDPRSQHKQHC